MGRARLTLKRISNDPVRKSTFKQRREVLLKKMQEFSNLCKAEAKGKGKGETEGEAEACLIVHDANGDPQPVTWPDNLTTEHSLIQKYERRKNEEPPIMFGIQDYFQIKKDKVEAEISKVRKDILKIKYPTSHPSFNNLGDEQLRNFIAMLDAKSKACSERINILKLQHQVQVNLDQNQTNSAASNSSQLSFMQNIYQSQLISTLMKPIDDNNHIASSLLKHDMDSQSQMPHFDPNHMQLMAKNNDVMNSANQVGSPLDCAQQVGSANHVDVPLDCTKQSDAATDSTNQLGEPDWDSLLEGLMDCPSLPYESLFHNNFLECQNVQQGAALHTLTPPMDDFQIHDYNSMLQAELFNHMNQEK